MIHVVKTLPSKLYIAFSGGIDSVVLAHKAMKQKRDITLVFFNHNNSLANSEQTFVEQFANKHCLPLMIGNTTKQMYGSKEKFWRDCRYEFFKGLDGVVATGHNLDDAVEWYLMTCLRGEGHYIEYNHANVIRPLLTTKKSDIVQHATHYGLEWFEDPTNNDVEFTGRNKIRHNILPQCLEINPGLYNTVKKNIERKIKLGYNESS